MTRSFKSKILNVPILALALMASAKAPNGSAVPAPPDIRAIPEDNLGYPVLISGDNGDQGSGFFLNTETATYLVTAKHVLFDPETMHRRDSGIQLLSYSKDPSETGLNRFRLDLATLDKAGNIKSHPSEDVAVVKIAVHANIDGSRTSVQMEQTLPGVTIVEKASSGIVGVALENVKTYSQVLTGNDIILFGYPNSIGLQLLNQIDPNRPLLRKGIVAGTNPSRQLIVLDCPVYQGNSGGPVLEIDRQALGVHLWIIGVVVESVPYDDMWKNVRQGYTNHTLLNSGYSIAVPMDPVLDLVK